MAEVEQYSLSDPAIIVSIIAIIILIAVCLCGIQQIVVSAPGVIDGGRPRYIVRTETSNI